MIPNRPWGIHLHYVFPCGTRLFESSWCSTSVYHSSAYIIHITYRSSLHWPKGNIFKLVSEAIYQDQYSTWLWLYQVIWFTCDKIVIVDEKGNQKMPCSFTELPCTLDDNTSVGLPHHLYTVWYNCLFDFVFSVDCVYNRYINLWVIVHIDCTPHGVLWLPEILQQK